MNLKYNQSLAEPVSDLQSVPLTATASHISIKFMEIAQTTYLETWKISQNPQGLII